MLNALVTLSCQGHATEYGGLGPMDSFRDLAGDFEPAFGSHEPEVGEPATGSDDRRMQVRAYNYWTSLLSGRDFPSIEDLEPASVAQFASHSVLLDFTAGPSNPVTAYVGAAVRRECEIDPEVETLTMVPEGSLLAQLSGHHAQTIDTRAPVGIEAEFVNQRGVGICYRGILMPFSSDGDTIDFVYGVFSWREQAAPAVRPHEVLVPRLPADSDDSDEFDALELGAGDIEALELDEIAEPAPAPPAPIPAPHLAWQDGPMRDPEVMQAAGEATLDDWLSAARATAEDAKAADGRSRNALYRALGLAYDFACAAIDAPDHYDQLLADAGIIAQARAPMTAVAKLVFGVDTDKARLTEYAAGLAFAAREQVPTGDFLSFIEAQPGGLKALVEAERRQRKPEVEFAGWRETAIRKLRTAEPRALDSLAGNGEFALILVRRSADGRVEPVAAVHDPALLDKALKRAAD